MLIAGVLKALCHDIGFKVDSTKFVPDPVFSRWTSGE